MDYESTLLKLKEQTSNLSLLILKNSLSEIEQNEKIKEISDCINLLSVEFDRQTNDLESIITHKSEYNSKEDINEIKFNNQEIKYLKSIAEREVINMNHEYNDFESFYTHHRYDLVLELL